MVSDNFLFVGSIFISLELAGLWKPSERCAFINLFTFNADFWMVMIINVYIWIHCHCDVPLKLRVLTDATRNSIWIILLLCSLMLLMLYWMLLRCSCSWDCRKRLEHSLSSSPLVIIVAVPSSRWRLVWVASIASCSGLRFTLLTIIGVPKFDLKRWHAFLI